MALPKKIKKFLPLTESKTLLPRRRELVDKINKDGTYLPKSLLHADLDKGFLDFVKTELETVVDGKKVPMVDILVTTQNWTQFTETWNFQNLDKNAEPPFITVVRVPEVKFGTNPALMYNIPNRKLYFYAQVPTWDGQRHGYDIYRIPQPVPVDISYTVKIICNRMRELNKFNKIVIEKFASRQAYANIKGHYIPIVMGDISDESVLDIEKRKYYIQSYSFTLLGFLIDEDEFEVSPAINRLLQIVEVDEKVTRRQVKNELEKEPKINVLFVVGNDEINERFDYTADLIVEKTKNISDFEVYINGSFFGNNPNKIQINTGDALRIVVTKKNESEESKITLMSIII
jgi:hypothetical protein